MPLLEREGRLTVDGGIQITRQLLLDQFGTDKVLWLGVRELDPIVH